MTEPDLATRLRAGDRRALARALTAVENREPESRALLAAIFPYTGRGLVVGITGPPGVGKSTLADVLASEARARGKRVAVLAIDPTSPFSGGAFLGDRFRMEAGSRDPEIFIRSMATRGHVGGLSGAAFEAIAILDGAGRDFIVVETVGVGQDEVEVAAAATVTLVVLAPGLGDELQAAKAGLLEVADLIVVNKADREGADGQVRDLETAFAPDAIFKTVATRGEGVLELLDAILNRAWPAEGRRRRFLAGWLRELLCQAALARIEPSAWERAVERLLSRSSDPFTAARGLLESEGMKIHHVGIAVRNLDEAAGRFCGLLGLDRGTRYDMPEWKVSALFIAVGDSNLELLEPQGEDSNVGKFLARRGEGLHHLCFEVDDIEASLEEFSRQGAELIDAKPRPGAGGHLVAFFYPKSTHGVLVELKQK